MNVEILSKENIISLTNKKIYCYGKSNLEEFLSTVTLRNQIVAVLENNTKSQGQTFNGIPVCSPLVLKEENPEDCAIIITAFYPAEVLEQLELHGVLNRNFKIFRFANHVEKIDLAYRKKYKDTPLEDIIIFRSGPIRSAYVPGTDFSDNARALFEYMLANDYNKKYKLVWLVKHPEKFAEYTKKPNVEFLSFDWEDSENPEERERYYHALCLAKCIFMTDAYGFTKNSREDQIRVQLWHGCGFKTRVNFARCEKRYEYTTVVSELYANIHADIYGLRKNQVLVTGYAKQDWLYQPYQEGLASMFGKRDASKYIFWLPTFRMAENQLSELNQYEINPETGLPIVERKSQLEELNRSLQEKNILLIIKLHPFQKDELVSGFDYSNIVLLRNSEMVDKDLIINRLLASADAMISDYSSAAVDFLTLNRPLAFTLDDVTEYENSRGFVFDNVRDWLPGKELYTLGDLERFLLEIAQGEDSTEEKRKKLLPLMHSYQDSNNSKRILEAVGLRK
ncbi:MAG: CDP-glycerol glycerophosphotransferase family protein [Lachnospiraceae bacterium]|nr:CDP-glycerol glycerophosphotransferase family protein [Lachnospiraceae bacterium]